MPKLEEMRQLRADALKRQLARGVVPTTAVGGVVLNKALPLVADRIREALAAKGPKGGTGSPVWWHTLKTLRPEVSALLGLRVTLDALAQGPQNRTRVSRLVGSALLTESVMRQRSKESPVIRGLLRKIARARRSEKAKRKLVRKMFFQIDHHRHVERVIVGSFFLSVVAEVFPLFTESVEFSPRAAGSTRKPHSTTVMRLSPEVSEFASRFTEQVPLLRPLFMPTDEVPLRWTSATGGGYGKEAGNGGQLLLRDCPEQAEAMVGGSYMDACNAAQETPWAINQNVWEVFKVLWAQGSTEAGLPSRERIVSPPSPPEGDAVATRQWKRRVVLNIEQEGVRCSEILAFSKRLWLCGKLAQLPRFYYPYALDFRGRMYPRAAYLTPQGSDVERGLLQFADGRALGSEEAAQWLKIHLANCYGVDKVSFDERLAWVQHNDREILATADDPLTNRWWTTADAPWQFLAAALDYSGYRQDGLAHVSRLPIGMDGSNNGLQLYALLTGDAALAKATNVLPTEAPHDIYRSVAERATVRLRAVAAGVGDAAVGASWILRELYPQGLPRSIAKRPVMTLAYGVTPFSARRYVVDSFRTDCEKAGKTLPDGINQYTVLTALGDAVWAEVSEGVQSALDCMAWIAELSGAVAEADEALCWTTPSGFPAVQYYEGLNTVQVKTTLGVIAKVKKRTQLLGPDGQTSVKSMVSAGPPNFVHSLDAAIMAETVRLCHWDGVSEFALVHDSFAVPAADAPRLARAIREAIVKVFSTDPLERFAEDVESILKTQVRRFVPKHEFEASVVLDSKYIFA